VDPYLFGAKNRESASSVISIHISIPKIKSVMFVHSRHPFGTEPNASVAKKESFTIQKPANVSFALKDFNLIQNKWFVNVQLTSLYSHKIKLVPNVKNHTFGIRKKKSALNVRMTQSTSLTLRNAFVQKKNHTLAHKKSA
jgi:hypothetical protein